MATPNMNIIGRSENLRHLNTFVHYERKPHNHEDNLTRAFLLVLRGVPVAHAAWLELVDQSHRAQGGTGVERLHGLPAPRFATQTASLPDGIKRIISLVQTDEQIFSSPDLASSDRRQVLDGVVSYDEFAIVIENKPHYRNIRPEQLRVNVPKGVVHDTRAACVAWKDVVLAWGRLLEARHVGPADAVLLGDFLDYIETYFPRLRPYSKVGLCGNDVDRLRRRCVELVKSIAPNSYRHHRGWAETIRLAPGQCALMVGCAALPRGNDVDITVEFDPGDTTAQARLLYTKVEASRVFDLGSRGWRVTPNLHLAYMTTNIVFMSVQMEPAAYWSTCASACREPNYGWIRTWRRAEHEKLFEFLVSQRLASRSDRKEFDRCLSSTPRDKINVCPGITMRWSVPIDEAAVLDARGQLEKRVRQVIEEGAAALGLKLPFG